MWQLTTIYKKISKLISKVGSCYVYWYFLSVFECAYEVERSVRRYLWIRSPHSLRSLLWSHHFWRSIFWEKIWLKIYKTRQKVESCEDTSEKSFYKFLLMHRLNWWFQRDIGGSTGKHGLAWRAETKYCLFGLSNG